MALSAALLVLAVRSAVVLVLPLVLFRREVAADLAAPDRAYVFFTIVAACGVLVPGSPTDRCWRPWFWAQSGC